MFNHYVTTSLQPLLANQGHFSNSLKDSVCSLRWTLQIFQCKISKISSVRASWYFFLSFFLSHFSVMQEWRFFEGSQLLDFRIRPANDLIQQQSPSPLHSSRTILSRLYCALSLWPHLVVIRVMLDDPTGIKYTLAHTGILNYKHASGYMGHKYVRHTFWSMPAHLMPYETFMHTHTHIHPEMQTVDASSSYMHDREIKLKGQFH